MAPEIVNDEKDLSKGDLRRIGIIIYYMYFQEYIYNGKNEHICYLKILFLEKKNWNQLMIKN